MLSRSTLLPCCTQSAQLNLACKAMAEAPPRRLARTPSSSGVWWKLGDPAESSSEVERRLRGIAEKEAAVRARMERRAAGAPAVRRKIAVTSLSLEVVALVYGLWTATRRGMGWRNRGLKLLLLLLPALAIPALVLPAFAQFRNMLDARDQQKLERLRAERKAKIGHFRGSLHNLQKLIEKYDPDAAAAADSNNEAAASKKLKRIHSRLNFHVGDD